MALERRGLSGKETSMAQDMTKRSGWITFAGLMAVIAGGYNSLSGIAALSDDDTLAARRQRTCSTCSYSRCGRSRF